MCIYGRASARSTSLALRAEETPKSLDSEHAPCDTYTLVAPQIWFGVDIRKITLYSGDKKIGY